MALFFRQHTDGTREVVALENQFAGATPSACWIVGGGASLDELPLERIASSPVPKMALNLAGARRIRPNFWTSYDPTIRFHRSIYLDAGIVKFVHPRRALDLVPETTFKVCESPNLYFFERDRRRGFHDFLTGAREGIVDWNDTLVQAIDLLTRLGFREFYLAGCEMIVRPSRAWIDAATKLGVSYRTGQLLGEFAQSCEQVGIARKRMQEWGTERQYHFGETKELAAAINTDQHYFRIAQYLRLSRRSMALTGVRLISVTPHSRLNDHFEFRSVEEVCREMAERVGDPFREPVEGLYTHTCDRTLTGVGPMRDYPPLHWSKETAGKGVNEEPARGAQLRAYLEHPIEVELDENA